MNETMNEMSVTEQAAVEGAEQTPVVTEVPVQGGVDTNKSNKTAPVQVQKRRQPLLGRLLLLLILAGSGYGAWLKRDYLVEFVTQRPWDEPYMMTSAVYECIGVDGGGADFKATFAIDIADRSIWKKIPLVPSNVAIIDSDLPAGAYLVLSDGKYIMITRKGGKVNVSVTFSVAVKEADPYKTVSFEREPSVTCMLKAALPEAQLDVSVAGAQSVEKSVSNSTTFVSASLPDGVPIQLSWKKALPDLADGATEYFSETKTLISIAEGIVTGEVRIDFSILHKPTHLLELVVPDGVTVLEVTGKDIRDWRTEKGKMAVHLEKPAIGPYALSVKYELSADMGKGVLKVPVIAGAGMGDKGVIGVVALSNVELKSSQIDKAYVIDSKELPQDIAGMTSKPVLLAYRYAEPDSSIILAVTQPGDVDILLSIIDRASLTIMQTRDGKRITRAAYRVRNNSSQFLRIQLPEGAELWSASVAGRVTQPVKDDQGRILLPLVKSQTRSMNASFPVEIVYTDAGDKPDAKGCGSAKIMLPVCSAPIMNLMVSLYVPEEGRYDDFDGTLRVVDRFSSPQLEVSAAEAVSRAEIANLVQQKIVQADVAAPDMEVHLPVSGKIYLMEKFLVIKDQQWIAYNYSRIGR